MNTKFPLNEIATAYIKYSKDKQIIKLLDKIVKYYEEHKYKDGEKEND